MLLQKLPKMNAKNSFTSVPSTFTGVNLSLQSLNSSPIGEDLGLLKKLRLEYSYEACDEEEVV